MEEKCDWAVHWTVFSDRRIASHRAGRTAAASTPSDSVWRLCKVLDLRTNRALRDSWRGGRMVSFSRKNKQKGKTDKQVCVYIIKRQLLCPASLRGEGGSSLELKTNA